MIVNVQEKLAAEGQCRLCERPAKGKGSRTLTRHRLVPGRYGGKYTVANVVPLCNICHIEIEAEDAVARRMLRPKLWPMEVAYVLRRMPEQWFELMYPKPATMSIDRYEVEQLIRSA